MAPRFAPASDPTTRRTGIRTADRLGAIRDDVETIDPDIGPGAGVESAGAGGRQLVENL
jgi:hypothetical protein